MSHEHPECMLICPLTAQTAEEMRADMDRAAKLGAEAVECRLDMLAEPASEQELARLLGDPPLLVIATCRPARQGGRYEGDEQRRLEILHLAAVLGADFIDVESDTPEDLRPAGNIIFSHHDFAGCPGNLAEIAAALDRSPAAVNKVAFAAAGPEDALRALEVVRNCRKATIAIAMGEAGVMSRILSRKVGAFGTFASLAAGAESAPGQPTIGEFKNLYRWDAIGPDTRVYGVIGFPVSHSMSPAIHNAAFAEVGADAVYVPLLIQPGRKNFNRFMDEALGREWLSLRGLSVTLPHKENALAYAGADNCDELTRRIGAVNTVTIDGSGKITGTNTDYAAAVDSLCAAMGIIRKDLAGREIGIIGAGGVGRALVAATVYYGARVTIYNRTVERAQRLAREFACRAAPLAEAQAADAEILINCTSVGMHPGTDATPLAKIPGSARVVFDTIYNPVETKLLRDAKSAGCLTVSGLEMFVGQAVAQFEAWTGLAAPKEAMRGVVLDWLSR